MAEYCRGSESLSIYQIGAPKYSKQVRDVVLRKSDLGAHGIQQAGVCRASRRHGEELCIKSKKAKFACERNPDKHSLEAVGILEQATDKEDMYFIYKINNSQFN